MPAFHFRPIPFVATLLLVALGCGLSYWQTQRAHQKETIEATLQLREHTPAIALPDPVDITAMEYTRVVLSGEFDADWPIYLDNRPMDGMAGIYVMMPFKLHNQNRYVMVARGWVPRNNQDRSAVKPYQTPVGTVQIEGMLKAGSGHVFDFGMAAALQPKALIQNLQLDAFTTASHLPVYPFIVEQTSAPADDGLLRNWPRASMGSERHRGYAFQWLALAATALLFFVVTSFGKRDGRKSEQQ